MYVCTWNGPLLLLLFVSRASRSISRQIARYRSHNGSTPPHTHTPYPTPTPNTTTGHLLAGTIKDTVTRFAHQRGHHVVRRFGWDCHGLPVEFEIDQELGIKDRDQVGFGLWVFGWWAVGGFF